MKESIIWDRLMKINSLIQQISLLLIVTIILNLIYNYEWSVSYMSPASFLEYSRAYILMRGYLITRIIQFASFLRKQDDLIPKYVYLGFIYIIIMSTIRIIFPEMYLRLYYNALISVGFEPFRVIFLGVLYYVVPIIDFLLTLLLLLVIRKKGILNS